MLRKLTFVNVRDAERTAERLSTQQRKVGDGRTGDLLRFVTLLGVQHDFVPTLAELVVNAPQELVECSGEIAEIFWTRRSPEIDEFLQLNSKLIH